MPSLEDWDTQRKANAPRLSTPTLAPRTIEAVRQQLRWERRAEQGYFTSSRLTFTSETVQSGPTVASAMAPGGVVSHI